MQLPPSGKYALCMALVSVLSAWIGRILPCKWFVHDCFPYKSFPFEKGGKLYLRLKIHKWQKKVPDLSRMFPGFLPPKVLDSLEPERLDEMIRETCVAEFVHCMLCAAAWIIGALIPGKGVAALQWIYILLGNLPYILIQRYNRPRLVQLKKRMESKERCDLGHENQNSPA